VEQVDAIAMKLQIDAAVRSPTLEIAVAHSNTTGGWQRLSGKLPAIRVHVYTLRDEPIGIERSVPRFSSTPRGPTIA